MSAQPEFADPSLETTEFVLVRHGQSTWNATGRWQGHADPPLSELGRGQAREAAAELAGQGAVRLLSSDLCRAMQTAAVVGEVLGLDAEERADLRELDVGRWTGQTREEIVASDAELLAAFESEDPDIRPGGGETRRELRHRVVAAAEALAREGRGGRIVAVVHLGVMRALVPGAEPANGEIVRATLADVRAAATARGDWRGVRV